MVTNENLVPIVIEKTGRIEHAYDIYSRLLKDRIVFIDGQVNDKTSNLIIAQMLFLSNEDGNNDIHFYINSPGGSISAGLAIYDTMQFLHCDVVTYCIGQSASMAAILLAGGKTNKRFILPNARVLLHQPLLLETMKGSATDLDIEAREILRLRDRVYNILAKHTRQSVEKIERDCDRNFWFEAKEAVDYGLVDKILQKSSEVIK